MCGERSMTRLICDLCVIKDSVFFVVSMLSNPYILVFQKPASKGVWPMTSCCMAFIGSFPHLLYCHPVAWNYAL